MQPPIKKRLPLFELTLLVVVVIIGLAELKIYHISQDVEVAQATALEEIDKLKKELASDRQSFERDRRELRARIVQANQQALAAKQENEQMQRMFAELNTDFTNFLPALEKAQSRDTVVVQDALKVKEAYFNIADRLESGLGAMQNDLNDFIERKSDVEAESFRRNSDEFKAWIAKERERIETDRIVAKTRSVQDAMRREQGDTTNAPTAFARDLTKVIQEVGRIHTNYLTNANYVLNNFGKPLIRNAPSEIARTRQLSSQLTRLAQQVRAEGKIVETFLEPQWTSRQTSRERAIQSIVRAQAQVEAVRLAHARSESNAVAAAAAADDSTELTIAPAIVDPTAVASTKQSPAFGFVSALYPLIVAQIGLTVFLMVAIYRRVVVEGLRFRLYESATETRLAHVGQLAAWLAHEIRQPLTAINAWLWTLQKTVTEGMPEHMGAMAMRKEINRLDQIVKDFLRFTQPAQPKLVAVQAESVLQEIQTLLAPQLQRQHIDLELGPVADARFYADPQQLKQVLMNLVTNAAESIEHEDKMDSGRITLRARRDKTQLRGENSDVVVIEVEDTGPGIPPEVQQRLFDPFFSTKEEGTGLGLPIAAKILETHGGELKFKTELGTGTTFRVVLPVVRKGV